MNPKTYSELQYILKDKFQEGSDSLSKLSSLAGEYHAKYIEALYRVTVQDLVAGPPPKPLYDDPAYSKVGLYIGSVGPPALLCDKVEFSVHD